MTTASKGRSFAILVTDFVSMASLCAGLTVSAILHLDIEACPTTTTACGIGIVHDLELTSDKLHCVVHLAPLEKIQAGFVQNDLGHVRSLSSWIRTTALHWFWHIRKDRIFFA